MDKYEKEHDKSIETLESCPKRVKDSCMPCSEYLKVCPKRVDYVKKTFQFLGKGKSGGFNF